MFALHKAVYAMHKHFKALPVLIMPEIHSSQEDLWCPDSPVAPGEQFHPIPLRHHQRPDPNTPSVLQKMNSKPNLAKSSSEGGELRS